MMVFNLSSNFFFNQPFTVVHNILLNLCGFLKHYTLFSHMHQASVFYKRDYVG